MELLIEGNNKDLCKKFMIKVHITINITVTSCPYPKNKFNFLYYLLMSFRKFECENQLFEDNNIKKAFIKVGLFYKENLLVSKDDLIRKIILHQFA